CVHGTRGASSHDSGEPFPAGGPLPGWQSMRGDPWLATGADGTIYMASLWNGLAELAVLRATVTEDGVTWSNPVRINQMGQFDKEAMAIDPYSGIIYVTYTRFGGTNGIWAARSLDGGLSFETPRPVADNPPVQLQGSFPVVGAYGELYVAYNLGYPGSNGVGFAASFDNGYTFSGFRQIASLTNFTVPGSDRAPAFPQ